MRCETETHTQAHELKHRDREMEENHKTKQEETANACLVYALWESQDVDGSMLH